MNKKTVILLSTGPVDAYPPVQHQARLLSDAGFEVELITVPLKATDNGVRFSYQNVRINVVPLRTGRGLQTIMRLVSFVSVSGRKRAAYKHGNLIEIAYDPLAMLISDYTPRRPSIRIAHFHEVLDAFDRTWIQKRLLRAIMGFKYVVVADKNRGELLFSQLKLNAHPIVVQNYPLLLPDMQCMKLEHKSKPFELIYAGSIGPDQKLDVILESLRYCPDHVYLTILGNPDLPTVKVLRNRANEIGLGHRLYFPGWIYYDSLCERLSRAHLGISLLDPHIQNWNYSVGASNKRYEYMRAGLPQIGDMNPGVSDLLEGNKIGLCLKKFCPVELGGLISQYADDPTRCQSEGACALKLHREIYNYQSSFAPIINAIL
jgi:glycosyltransferase involved in cell wall biosynthesis